MRADTRRKLLAWAFPSYLAVMMVGATILHFAGITQPGPVRATRVVNSVTPAAPQYPQSPPDPADDVQRLAPPAQQPAPRVVIAQQVGIKSRLLVVLGCGLLMLLTLMTPLCALSTAWSRGPLRGFHFGASLGAGTLGTMAMLFGLFVGGAAATDWDGLQREFSNTIRLLFPVIFHWQWVAFTGGALGALLVWATQGPHRFPSYARYRVAHRRRLITTISIIAVGLAALPLLPDTLAQLLLLTCGFLLLPLFALAGVICGRPRLRATCLPWSPLWLSLPMVSWQIVKLTAEQIADPTSAFESKTIVYQICVVVTFGFSSLLARLLFNSLRADRSGQRRQRGERGERGERGDVCGSGSCCQSNCSVHTTLFSSGCVCDGGCEP